MLDLKALLKNTVAQKASDLHIKPGIAPHLRIHGDLMPLASLPPVSREETRQLAEQLLSAHQRENLAKKLEVDHAFGEEGLGRFRLAVFYQRGSLSLIFRFIPDIVPTLEELNLPKILKQIAQEPRGLVVVTGATGSGKSTTLASMIRHLNQTRRAHIITIEDPIEFLFPDNQSVITQREISQDTENFTSALRSALRQDPDVIMLGDMRDVETVQIALQAAETGHLVLSTLHTPDAVESVSRTISIFPAHQQNNIRFQFAAVLRAILSIRLIRSSVTGGRVPAVEILRNTQMVRSRIEDAAGVKEIKRALETGTSQYGMQSFDQSLLDLYQRELISMSDALRNATSPDDLKLRIKGIVISSETV